MIPRADNLALFETHAPTNAIMSGSKAQTLIVIHPKGIHPHCPLTRGKVAA